MSGHPLVEILAQPPALQHVELSSEPADDAGLHLREIAVEHLDTDQVNEEADHAREHLQWISVELVNVFGLHAVAERLIHSIHDVVFLRPHPRRGLLEIVWLKFLRAPAAGACAIIHEHAPEPTIWARAFEHGADLLHGRVGDGLEHREQRNHGSRRLGIDDHGLHGGCL